MKLGLRIICTILLTSILATAASTKFVSTWSNPTAGSLGQAGKRVAAFVLSSDETMRQGPAETLATEMRRRGIDCLAGYTVLPGELAKDLEKAKAFVKKSGITGAILMRVVGKEEQTRYTPVRRVVFGTPLFQLLGLLGLRMVVGLYTRLSDFGDDPVG